MFIENRMTVADAARSLQVPATVDMVTSAHMAVLEACDVFAEKLVTPFAMTALGPSDRERALFGLYYRLSALIKTGILLDRPVHFQSLTGASRTAIEIYVDAVFLHKNLISDGVERFHTFTDVQRLNAAKRLVKYLDDNPHLDDHTTQPQRDFINTRAVGINADVVRLWGTNSSGAPNVPQHWTQLNLLDRADRVDDDTSMLARRYYDLRNFAVHTGVAGVQGIERSGFTIMCLLSFEAIGTCFISVMQILMRELQLHRAITDFAIRLSELEQVAVLALTDLRLRHLGDEPKYILHP